jgi:hypothetical protein
MRKSAAILAMVALVVCAGAIGASRQAQAPAPRKEIEKLDAFVGEWTASGAMKDTAYSKAGPGSSRFTCAWAPNHGFLVCDQLIDLADGVANSLTIYTYNEKDNAFAFLAVSRNDPRPRTPKLKIEGKVWTYSGEFDDGIKHIQVRTTNEFTSATTLVWRSEYSEDGAKWTVMGQGSDTRTK